MKESLKLSVSLRQLLGLPAKLKEYPEQRVFAYLERISARSHRPIDDVLDLSVRELLALKEKLERLERDGDPKSTPTPTPAADDDATATTVDADDDATATVAITATVQDSAATATDATQPGLVIPGCSGTANPQNPRRKRVSSPYGY